MEVKSIIKKVLNLLQDSSLVEAIDNNTFTDEQQKSINLLVDCVNLTNCNIATNYVKLFNVVKRSSVRGMVEYSKISSNMIYDIVSIKNSVGNDVNYTLTQDGIVTGNGVFDIKYTYFPADLEYSSSVLDYPTKVSEKVFVYGVLAEYLFATGVYDDAKMWEEKFEKEMNNCKHSQKNTKINARRWM